MLLQEFGQAGRKPGVSANAVLFFNECIDDKHLGVWLKSSPNPHTNDNAYDGTKAEVLATYVHQNLHGSMPTLFIMLSAYYGCCPISMVGQMMEIHLHALLQMLLFALCVKLLI